MSGRVNTSAVVDIDLFLQNHVKFLVSLCMIVFFFFFSLFSSTPHCFDPEQVWPVIVGEKVGLRRKFVTLNWKGI